MVLLTFVYKNLFRKFGKKIKTWNNFFFFLENENTFLFVQSCSALNLQLIDVKYM